MIKIDPRIDPITIPAIAPPESLLLLPSFEQELRGLPHKSLPVNDSIGKLARRVGILPLSLFIETLNCVKEVLMSGICPVNWLFCRKRSVNLVKLLKLGDISPEKLLPEMSNRVRLESLKRVTGISPENRLFCRLSISSSEQNSRSCGISPERRFPRRLSA